MSVIVPVALAVFAAFLSYMVDSQWPSTFEIILMTYVLQIKFSTSDTKKDRSNR